MNIQPSHADILKALYESKIYDTDGLPYTAWKDLLRAQLVTEVAPPFQSGTHKFNRLPMLTPAGLEKCRELFGRIENEPKTASAIRYSDDD